MCRAITSQDDLPEGPKQFAQVLRVKHSSDTDVSVRSPLDGLIDYAGPKVQINLKRV
jgi:hypothetical protein